jgi:hypothetical protein
MSNGEPESAGDGPAGDFEVEVSSLTPADEERALPPVGASFNRRLSPRARIWRAAIVSSAFVALLAVLGSNAAWRHDALALFFGTPAPMQTPTAFPLATLRPSPRPEDWALLEERPLRLPALAPGRPCPRTQGDMVNIDTDQAVGFSPVYAVFGGGSLAHGVLRYQDAGFLGAGGARDWSAQSVTWFIRPVYSGPAIVRGRQINGPNVLRFNGGLDQQQVVGSWSQAPLLAELRLLGNADGVSWFYWVSYLRLRAPGCYAYQVDGITFSYTIIFQALPEGT